MPTVSVLVVTCDAGAYLRAAIDSLLKQTLEDLEIVLVDNASRDGSVAELEAEVDDPRLRIRRLPRNLGPYGGAMAGLPDCTGRFVARADADDLCEPDRLELQVAALERDGSLGGVGCFSRMIDESGRTVGLFDCPTTPEAIAAASATRIPLHHPTLACRRDVFEQVPYRTEYDVAGDHDFVARAVERWRFAALPSQLYQYRVHAGSITAGRRALQVAFGNVARVTTARRRSGRPERLTEEAARARELASRLGTAHRVNEEAARRFREDGWADLANWCAAEAQRQALLAGDRGIALSMGLARARWKPSVALRAALLAGAALLPRAVVDRLLALRWPLRRWRSRRMARHAAPGRSH